MNIPQTVTERRNHIAENLADAERRLKAALTEWEIARFAFDHTKTALAHIDFIIQEMANQEETP